MVKVESVDGERAIGLCKEQKKVKYAIKSKKII